jgi:hypothetical protein
MGHEGRSLEELVFNLERMLASESALIRSPDFIQGKNSGTTREVDISIRAKVGSADLLVIVECRDRNSKQDVRWIEELSGKQIDVQANKVIAVSRRGFTEAAISAARNLNIDLRTFDSIDAEDLATWVTFRVPTFIRHRLDACTLHFDKLERAGSDPKSFIESLRNEDLLKITRLTDGKVVAIQEIMSDLQRKGDHVPQTLVSRWPDGFSISVDTSRYKYVIDGQDGQRAYLTRIDLAGDFTAGIDILTPHLGKRYIDGGSALSLIAETIVTGPRGPVAISAKANTDRSRFHISVSCGDEVGELLLDENGRLIESCSGHSAHEVQSRPGAGSAVQDR